MTAMMAETTTTLMKWVSPGTMHSLGWALVHFLWQGTALAALAAGAMALFRRASVRYLIGAAVLVLMLLAPVATFFSGHDGSGGADAAKSSPLAAVAWPIARGNTAASGSAPFLMPRSAHRANWWQKLSTAVASLDALPWLVEAWLLGVAFFSLRTAGGFLLLARERRRNSNAVASRVLQICHTLQRRIGLSRAISYRECKWLQAPAVIGWFRPVVFLPVSALTGLSEEQLNSVIAHELAHIRRFDPFVNVFQVWVETLLFYHPAVWWLNKRIRDEREHCCDEAAVSVCGNAVEYARALTLMEEWRTVPALAMAANRGPLTERIVRVIGLKTSGANVRGVGLTSSVLCLTAALIAGSALLGMAHSAPQISFLSQAGRTATTPAAPPAPKAAPSPKPSAGQPANSNQTAPSYIDEMKAAGLGDLTVDQLVALKIQGVTPEYVRDVNQLGLKPNADEFVSLKVQGVTPEYIKGLRALGFNPDLDQIVGMKVQGVDADYVHSLKEVGVTGDADDFVGMKVQGVTAGYVKELRALGLNVTADDVVGLKVQGVTASYVKGLQDLGLKPSADEVVGLKVQGITAEYVRDIRALGLNPSADDLLAMKVQGVTPEYIRDIRALGFNPDADELVGMRVQGVTPELIKALQAAGFKPTIDQIVDAKVQGVTPEFIETVHKHGFKDLTIDKLIELKRLGILESKGEL